jgi:inosose dehydratase
MRSLGLRATEAGADGFLPDDGAELASALSEHDLAFVGGFVPVVLHQAAALDATLARVRQQAARFTRGGGSVLASAIVVDDDWSPRVRLSADDWRRIADGLARIDEVCAEHGIAHVLHPHVGALVETRDDVARILEESDVLLCLDTGHFAIGGVDSVALARETPHRVAHVHLKDVRESVATELRAGRTTLVDATRHGLFVPLGDGDVPLADVLAELERAGYDGWLVLEQDTVIMHADDVARPADDTRRSIDFLRALAAAGRGLAETAGGR